MREVYGYLFIKQIFQKTVGIFSSLFFEQQNRSHASPRQFFLMPM